MLLKAQNKKLLIEELNFFEVFLSSQRFKYLHSVIGNFSCIPSMEFLKSLADEALRKYERMHFEQPQIRVEKSWTGFIGEFVCEQYLRHQNKTIIQKPEVALKKGDYDLGDIWLESKNKEKIIINVSSRKLSRNDSITNFYENQHNYICLIPKDQIKQYTEKANYALFVFLIPQSDETMKIHTFDDSELKVKISLTVDFIIAGFLESTSISSLLEKKYYLNLVKGSSFIGMFNDLDYRVKMYTDNIGIPSTLLKPIQKLIDVI